jgi:predicted permease
VSSGFFAALGVAPAFGRLPSAEEHAGAVPVAVISDAFWREALGSSPLGGRRLEAEGASFAVIGVMPAGFDLPRRARAWVPIELFEPSPHRSAHNHQVIARLAPGVSRERAERELSALTARVARSGPDAAEAADYLPVGARVHTLQAYTAQPVRTPLLLLLGAAGFVLLVCAANLASAFLARGMERRRELLVRLSLGASRGALLRQLVAEGVVLGVFGGLGGLALAATLGQAVIAGAPALLAEAGVTLDVPLAGLALVAAVVASAVASLLPALLATGALASARDGRGSTGISPAQRRAWGTLVAAQAGLTLVLMVGSGLLLRSFAGMLAVEPGFVAEGAATLEVAAPATRYPDDVALAGFHQRLLAAVEGAPGVVAAGTISALPLAGHGPNGQMIALPDTRADAEYRIASGGYFRAAGIPLLAGRTFEGRDRQGAPAVAVVDRAAAELFWPGLDPLGQQIDSAGMDGEWRGIAATVVGVVGDVRQHDLTGAPDPSVYFALAQRPRTDAVLVARARTRAADLAPLLRSALASTAPEVPGEVGTLAQPLAGARAQRRFALVLLAVFAALTLALAAVGVYGVVAHAVQRRRREMGVRLALGAAPAQARMLLLRVALVPVAVGIAGGALAALPLARTLEALLFAVRPWDPVCWVGGASVLAAVALAAGWLPARAVTTLDPMQTLRAE